MSGGTLSMAARLALGALGAVALAYVAVLVWLMAVRVPFPFALEWMEEGSLQQVRRILAGEKLYVAPSLDFIPYIYPPLYFYVSAIAAKVMGLSYVPLRLVSVAASLGSAGLVGWIVKREVGDAFAGLLAGCLFLATFHFSGAWFDVGRVDALYLVLFLAGLALLRFAATMRGAVAAGVCFALAYLTKQLAVAMAAPVLVAAVWLHWRRGLAAAGVATALAIGATWVLDAWHDGWYRFYIFETLTRHGLEHAMWVGFWTRDLARPLLVACLAALAVLAVDARGGDRRRAVFYLAAGVAMVGGSYASRLNFGGYANVLLWGYAWLAILAGLGFGLARARIAAMAPGRREWATLGLAALGLSQFALLAYSPLRHLPSAADAATGEAIVERLGALPGPVWVPYHPELAMRAGHPGHAHGMALVELLWGQGPVVDALKREVTEAVTSGRFGAIVLDAGWFPPELESAMSARYRSAGPLVPASEAAYPLTGMRTRPERLYLKSAP